MIIICERKFKMENTINEVCNLENEKIYKIKTKNSEYLFGIKIDYNSRKKNHYISCSDLKS